MEIRKGIGVSAGYAIGEAFVLDREEYRVSRRRLAAGEADAEIARLDRAVVAAAVELRAQVGSMSQKVRDVAGAMLEAQVALLQDPNLRQETIGEIRKNLVTADFAVSRTLRRKIKLLEESGAAGFARRILSDFIELERSLLRQLLGGKQEDMAHLDRRVIVVGHDLSPSQAIGLDRTKVLGILTEVGGLTSHTAIVAKSLGIPAVVGVESVSSDLTSGDLVILDGATGTVLTHPDEATVQRYRGLETRYLQLERQRARELHNLPAVTTDGTRVEILANIESPDEIPGALEHGAEGIGLYRTEFLFLSHGFDPSDRVHEEAYLKATHLLGNRRIVIRTLDLGADKMPASGIGREANPFLGTRAIRLCFERPEMFKAQLRAILHAAHRGNVALMVPMISSLSEVKQVKETLAEVRRELAREGKSTGEGIPVGIMIEVPSAAVVADQLAPHVDFFSVGTNDLIAYSIAVDRANERVAPLYQPGHPAVLRLLKGVIEAGTKAGKSVSVCGEMSSDLNFTLLLLGFGLRTFSVVPPIIPDLKKLIRSVSIAEAREIAEKALAFDDSAAVVGFLAGETRKRLQETA
jgi:phosphotransferase system enzyme I (PtsI)